MRRLSHTRPKNSAQKRQADFFQFCCSCRTGCCNRVRPPITTRRRTIIESYLDAEGLRIGAPFHKGVYTFPRETEEGYCIFFNQDTKKCHIHPVKPETCVAGPVTFDINLQTGKIEWFLKTEKICPLAGALHKNKSELQSHMESARRELLKLVHDLDAEALNAILKIEEPETFKISEEDLSPDVFAKLKLSA